MVATPVGTTAQKQTGPDGHLRRTDCACDLPAADVAHERVGVAGPKPMLAVEPVTA